MFEQNYLLHQAIATWRERREKGVKGEMKRRGGLVNWGMVRIIKDKGRGYRERERL